MDSMRRRKGRWAMAGLEAESRRVRKTITKSIAIGKSKAKSAMQIVEIMGLQMYEERDGAECETQGAAEKDPKGIQGGRRTKVPGRRCYVYVCTSV